MNENLFKNFDFFFEDYKKKLTKIINSIDTNYENLMQILDKIFENFLDLVIISIKNTKHLISEKLKKEIKFNKKKIFNFN